MTVFENLSKGLAVFQNNSEDPYITVKDEDDDEDKQDENIKPTDNLILSGKTEEDVSYLEVYVYDNVDDNLYVHHDIMLPSFPLCVEPIHFDLTEKNQGSTAAGNFCAIGTFQPEIEIWNLDVVDAMYPHAVLGLPTEDEPSSESKSKDKKKKKKKNKVMSLPTRHTDAVLGLSWNRNARNLLASCSADKTVKLWDLCEQKCIQSYNHHQDKVAVVQFNPSEPSALLSGSYDRTLAAFDARSPDVVYSWRLQADTECLKWDPHQPNCFVVSTEDGVVQYFDARAATTKNGAQKPLFKLAAHSYSVSSLDINPFIPGLMVTGSADKTIKIWDIQSGKPSMIATRDFQLGKIFATSFCTDNPYTCAIGGSKGNLVVWNITECAAVRKTFDGRKTSHGTVSMQGPGALTADMLDENENAKNDEYEDSDESENSEVEMEEMLEEMSGVRLKE